jgi:small subunit ribosomal protein S1
MDGLVHISDMSWTKRIKHPSEIVHRGEKVEVMVLGIDKDRHRISLGIKQCHENPWPDIADRYAVGAHVDGRVSRIHKSGIVVEIPEDIEGFVPMSHLALPDISRVEARFASGDMIPLEVIEVSPENRRIVLSVKSYMEKQPDETLQEYIAAHEVRPELLESEPEEDEGEREDAQQESASAEEPEEKPEGEAPAEEPEAKEEAPSDETRAEAATAASGTGDGETEDDDDSRAGAVQDESSSGGSEPESESPAEGGSEEAEEPASEDGETTEDEEPR